MSSAPPLVIGIDPGLATCGLVIADSERRVLRALSIKTTPADGNMISRSRKVVAAITQALVYFEGRKAVVVLEEYRSSRGSRSAADTHYGRGIVDGMLLHLFPCPLPIIVPNFRVKAFCHPRGVASDKGRKKELEYRSALNMLDRVLDPKNLETIANPDIVCDESKWKQGRLHTLDAGALAGIGILVVNKDIEAYPHQMEIAEAFRGLAPQCLSNLSMRMISTLTSSGG